MVWPDSASGGLIASAHLLQQYKISGDQLRQATTYRGSHQKVLASLTTGSVAILDGLQQGWPEFQSSDSLISVDEKMYQTLSKALQQP